MSDRFFFRLPVYSQKSPTIIIVMIIVIKNEFDFGGTVALLLQDDRTMLPVKCLHKRK